MKKRRTEGSVQWFNPRKGYGFITSKDGKNNIFVFYKSIKASGYKKLVPGQKVKFDLVLNKNKQLQARNVVII